MEKINKERFTYLIGGKAGEGVKKAGTAAANLFKTMGRRVFEMDDYQSLIRGGHNYSVVSTAVEDITSHYMEADLLINLDKRSYENHKEHLSEDGIMVFNSDKFDSEGGIGIELSSIAKGYSNPDLILGVSGIAILSAVLDIDKKDMLDLVEKEYSRGVEENKDYAEKVFEKAVDSIDKKFKLEHGNNHQDILTGNQALSLGAIAGGLDIYVAYPMTPASSILHYLAKLKDDLDIVSVHPENEIGVANIALGATMAGAKSMVGSSGGGIALMEETFSLAGMTESPLLFILSSRPGPSTGVPTYTEQGDLNFALNQGHGEFPRIVSSPGSIEEAFYLASEMLSLIWDFQTPGIILTEKHLSESAMSVNLDVNKTKWAEGKRGEDEVYKRYLDTEDGISPLMFPPSSELIKWNSYEHDERGITTENSETIVKMHDKRARKGKKLIEKMKDMKTVNTYGNGESVIFTYGSTTMSVLEALRYESIDAKVVQPVYLKPFPIWELEEYMDKDIIVVEQSSTGQFAKLLRDKANLVPKTVIRKYDGRPFSPSELSVKLKEAVE